MSALPTSFAILFIVWRMARAIQIEGGEISNYAVGQFMIMITVALTGGTIGWFYALFCSREARPADRKD